MKPRIMKLLLFILLLSLTSNVMGSHPSKFMGKVSYFVMLTSLAAHTNAYPATNTDVDNITAKKTAEMETNSAGKCCHGYRV
jgi:hypothetical protein